MNPTKRPWLKTFPQGIPSEIEIPEATMIDYLDQAVSRNRNHPALVFEGQAYTYGELADKVNRLANGLASLGVVKGTRVALMMNNCPESVFSYYAILRLGAIVVQNNPMYTERELTNQLKDSGAEVLIIESRLLSRFQDLLSGTNLRHIVTARTGEEKNVEQHLFSVENLISSNDPLLDNTAINPNDDIAVLQYTGGTTGVSKGVMLTHRNIVANILQTKAFMGVYCNYGQEKILNVLPLFHVYGMTVSLNFSVYLGSTLYLMERFAPQTVLEIIDRERITMFPGTPTMYVGVINHPDVSSYNLTSIHSCISGSAPLPVEVKKTFEELTGASLVDAYGLSEASPVTHSNPVNGKKVPRSIGLPITGTDCMIVDMDEGTQEMPINTPGELIIKGPQVMKGYWNRPEETSHALRNGWLYTGDVAYMDEEGYFYLVSRKKDVIIAGGYNIYPREIEEVIFEHPAIREVVAVGIPHPYRGETVKVFAVLKEGLSITEEELKAFCSERLAKFKVPSEFEFRKELPKTTVGKILRRSLIEEEKSRQNN